MNAALAAAAASLLGVRFRLHGREPRTGLDCVGLVAEAMRRSGIEPVVPEGYRLRNLSVRGLLPFVEANRLEPVGQPDDADVLLAMVSPVQPHLLICAPGGSIHAHAGIGRVTFLPGLVPWQVANGWRLPISKPSIGS